MDLAKHLLVEVCRDKKKEKIIIITFDTFKTKLINKGNIASTIETELKLKYPNSNFQVTFGTSEEANLQFADQICGVIHRFAFGDKSNYSKLKKILKHKTIKNPFSRQ